MTAIIDGGRQKKTKQKYDTHYIQTETYLSIQNIKMPIVC